MSRVSVVGAGNVGMIVAAKVAESDFFDEVVLVDIDDGRAAGIALDITHASPLLGFSTRVRGVGTMDEAGESDYVVITAGQARKPGMSRSDLVSTNAAIVGSVASAVAQVSPDAVIIVVTNPLDEMTQHAQRASGFAPERVIGMAGVLDSARFQALSAIEANVPVSAVRAIALGSHGPEMVLPLSQATISGRPITDILTEPVVDALIDRARNSGAEVVGLLVTGSAFISPGTSAAQMVLDMARDNTENVISATVSPSGEYGIDGGYVGLPVRLGRKGVAEIVRLDLTDGEVAALRNAASNIAGRVAQMDPA